MGSDIWEYLFYAWHWYGLIKSCSIYYLLENYLQNRLRIKLQINASDQKAQRTMCGIVVYIVFYKLERINFSQLPDEDSLSWVRILTRFTPMILITLVKSASSVLAEFTLNSSICNHKLSSLVLDRGAPWLTCCKLQPAHNWQRKARANTRQSNPNNQRWSIRPKLGCFKYKRTMSYFIRLQSNMSGSSSCQSRLEKERCRLGRKE